MSRTRTSNPQRLCDHEFGGTGIWLPRAAKPRSRHSCGPANDAIEQGVFGRKPAGIPCELCDGSEAACVRCERSRAVDRFIPVCYDALFCIEMPGLPGYSTDTVDANALYFDGMSRPARGISDTKQRPGSLGIVTCYAVPGRIICRCAGNLYTVPHAGPTWMILFQSQTSTISILETIR